MTDRRTRADKVRVPWAVYWSMVEAFAASLFMAGLVLTVLSFPDPIRPGFDWFQLLVGLTVWSGSTWTLLYANGAREQ